MTLINEKLGQKVFDTYLRFQENLETNTPNLILEDLGYQHIYYRLRMLKYNIKNETTIETASHNKYISTNIITTIKSRDASPRAFKKLKLLMKSKNLDIDLQPGNLFKIFLEPFLNREFTPFRSIQYNGNKVTIIQILTEEDYQFLQRRCKFDKLRNNQ